ncbi:MAG: PilZ domain-containing protein [Alphaproteobacteria bacterium]|nr:PilZ domain-containing protein [Alphaproteobacteria bacterium]MBL6937680.1 PilZ domain-containing protein [Alphaproteobacteria bacterium]MBL7099018.1 PilZ domain-containing protein [Alphaproteobacteria bacterium]
MGKLARKAEPSEKRTHKRVPIAIAGQVFLPSRDTEQNCIVTDISLGGATLQCDERLAVGTELVLYLPGFDRFSGTIMHSSAEESGMKFDCSESERERTAEKIMLYLAGALRDDTQVRTETRVAMHAPRIFTRADGEIVRFQVRDISLSGASINTTARPPVGEIVMIGNTPGRVTRHFDEGIALEFVRMD